MKLKITEKLSKALNIDRKINPMYDGLVIKANGFCTFTGSWGAILLNIKLIYCANSKPFNMANGPRIYTIALPSGFIFCLINSIVALSFWLKFLVL